LERGFSFFWGWGGVMTCGQNLLFSIFKRIIHFFSVLQQHNKAAKVPLSASARWAEKVPLSASARWAEKEKLWKKNQKKIYFSYVLFLF